MKLEQNTNAVTRYWNAFYLEIRYIVQHI